MCCFSLPERIQQVLQFEVGLGWDHFFGAVVAVTPGTKSRASGRSIPGHGNIRDKKIRRVLIEIYVGPETSGPIDYNTGGPKLQIIFRFWGARVANIDRSIRLKFIRLSILQTLV